MSDLRSKLIRLAHENPELRKDILPLLDKKARRMPEELKDPAVRKALQKLRAEITNAYWRRHGTGSDPTPSEWDAFEDWLDFVYGWLFKHFETSGIY